MSDLLLLAGLALCVLSVLLAVFQLLQTQPPRAAALALLGGIVLIFAGAYLDPAPFGVDTIPAAVRDATGMQTAP